MFFLTRSTSQFVFYRFLKQHQRLKQRVLYHQHMVIRHLLRQLLNKQILIRYNLLILVMVLCLFHHRLVNSHSCAGFNSLIFQFPPANMMQTISPTSFYPPPPPPPPPLPTPITSAEDQAPGTSSNISLPSSKSSQYFYIPDRPK